MHLDIHPFISSFFTFTYRLSYRTSVTSHNSVVKILISAKIVIFFSATICFSLLFTFNCHTSENSWSTQSATICFVAKTASLKKQHLNWILRFTFSEQIYEVCLGEKLTKRSNILQMKTEVLGWKEVIYSVGFTLARHFLILVSVANPQKQTIKAESGFKSLFPQPPGMFDQFLIVTVTLTKRVWLCFFVFSRKYFIT